MSVSVNPKPLPPLTRFLVLLLKLYLGVLFVAAVAAAYTALDYSRLEPGAYDPQQLRGSDLVTAVVGLIHLSGFVFLGVTFLRWIYRANQNLQAVWDQRMEFTPGWAVGWYFIPFANLFKPYQAMKEMWAVAHREPAQGNTLLQSWWTLWLISNFIGHIVFRAGLNANDAPSTAFSAAIDAGAAVFDIPLTIVALLLVRRIGDAYEKNYAAHEQPPPLPSAA